MSEEAAFDQMATDVRDTLGVSATFIPEIGDRVTLTLFFNQTISDQPDGYQGTALGYRQEVEFYFSDLGRLPEPGEQFLVDSVYYVVEKVTFHDRQGRFCRVSVLNG